MAKDKAGQAALEEKVAQAEQEIKELEEKPPKTQVEQTTTQDAQEIQQQLAALQAELAKAKSEAEAHRLGASRKGKEVEELQSRIARQDALSHKVDILTEMVADLVDRDLIEENEIKPSQRRSDIYRQKIEELKSQSSKELNAFQEQSRQQIAGEVLRQLQSVGLGPEAIETLEFRNAENLFLKGRAEEGLEETRRIVGTMQTSKQPKESEAEREAKHNQEIEEAVRKRLEKLNILKTDIGTPQASSGQVFTMAEVQNMPPVKYRELFPHGFPDVAKAVSEGRVKV